MIGELVWKEEFPKHYRKRNDEILKILTSYLGYVGDLMNSLKKNYVYNLILNIGNYLLGFITYPYVTRVLGPEYLGKANYANSIVSYFVLIGGLGINAYAIREGGKYRKDSERLGKFVAELIIITLASSIIAFIALLTVIVFSDNLTTKILLLVYGVNVFSTNLSCNWFFAMNEEFEYIAIRTLLVRLISVVATFLFIKTPSDVFWYSGISSLVSVITMIMNGFVIRRNIKIFYYKGYNIKEHIIPVIVLFASAVAVELYVNSDVTLIGLMRSDCEVGLYSSVYRIVQIISLLFGGITTVLLPRASYFYKQKMDSEYMEYVSKGINYLLMFSIPTCVGFFMLGEDVIRYVLGTQYIGAVLCIRIMSFNIVLSTLSGFISSVVVLTHDKEKIYMISTTVAAVENIMLNLVAIRYFSINGAATTTLLAEATNIVVGVFCTRMDVSYKSLFSKVYQYCITALCIVPITMFIRKIVGASFICMFIQVGMSIITYCLGLMIFHNEYLKDLINLFKHRVGGNVND